MAVIAMFPLDMVLLPGGVLPLDVFEPRDRETMAGCLKEHGKPEFGQVLVGGGFDSTEPKQRAMVGTVAQMVQVESSDDGPCALVTVGTRRIRVNAWLPDDPHPMADVDDWPDEDPDPCGLGLAVSATHRRVRETLVLAALLGEVDADLVDSEISCDPLVATYHLASLSPIGPADRFRLLAANGPMARLEVLNDVLDDVEAELRRRLG